MSPRRPERIRRPAAWLLALAFAAVPIHAAGYLDSPGEEKRFQPFFLLEGGVNIYKCMQAGAYLGLQKSWQAGLELRSWAFRAHAAYDFIPEADIHLRKLWLGAEESEALRNSEYADAALGLYPSYRYGSSETFGEADPGRGGLHPQGRVTVGKYWMPFQALAFGLDANLSLGAYYNGYPWHFRGNPFVAATVSLFWKKPID